jgi:hypothetical protein
MENRNLGYKNTVVIHVGTNNVRRYRNLDYVMGEFFFIYIIANLQSTPPGAISKCVYS